MTRFQPSSPSDLAMLNPRRRKKKGFKLSRRTRGRTRGRGQSSAPSAPSFVWTDISQMSIPAWSNTDIALLPSGDIEGGPTAFTDPSQVSSLMGYYLTYPADRMGSGKLGAPAGSPDGEQVKYLVLNRLDHTRKWMDWVLSQGAQPSVAFTISRFTGDVSVTSFSPADHGLALLNPDAAKMARRAARQGITVEELQAKRTAKAERHAEARGITVEAAMEELRARAKGRKKDRKALKTGKTSAITAEEEEEEEEFYDEEEPEAEDSNMTTYLLIGGAVAIGLGTFWFLKGR